jgi:hypothetical protein
MFVALSLQSELYVSELSKHMSAIHHANEMALMAEHGHQLELEEAR